MQNVVPSLDPKIMKDIMRIICHRKIVGVLGIGGLYSNEGRINMKITTNLLIASAITGVIGLVYVCILIRSILKASRGTQCMSDISEAISLGAQAFIKREYLYLGLCVVGIAILMGLFIDYRESVTFLWGVST
jgi:hypothetical protein